MSASSDFQKLKQFDIQELSAENTNLKALLSSLKSETSLEIQVLRTQNKEYRDILNNVQLKTNKHILEMQQSWEKKCFLLETQNKKLEIDLHKTQKLYEDLQVFYRENELLKIKETEKSRTWNDELRKNDQEVKKWKEKFGISEERGKDLMVENEVLFSELQKSKKAAEIAEMKSENYLNEFQRKITMLENEYNKANATIVKLERQNESKDVKMNQLQSEMLSYKEKLEKLMENTNSELNEIIKNFEEKNDILKRKNEALLEENANLKALNNKYQEDIRDVQAYYGNLMGSLQNNIRENIKETLKLSNSQFSTPIRMENMSNSYEKGFNEGSEGRDGDGVSLKFIHKYQ